MSAESLTMIVKMSGGRISKDTLDIPVKMKGRDVNRTTNDE